MAYETTDAFLALAQTNAPAIAAARSLSVQAAPVISETQSAASSLRAALVAMQGTETDARILATIVEADDIQKTIYRLSGEIQDRIMQILPVLSRHDAMIARITALRADAA
jgi:NurA-like 5'-3' nuclease